MKFRETLALSVLAGIFFLLACHVSHEIKSEKQLEWPAEIYPACVRIECEVESIWGPRPLRGSGVVIAPRRVLTAAHVIHEATGLQICVYLRDDFHRTLPARLLKEEEALDLALLEVDEDLPASVVVGMGAAEQLKLHAPLLHVGAMNGMNPHIRTKGEFITRDVSESPAAAGCWLACVPSEEGASGGGLFTPDGFLIGLVVMGDRAGVTCLFVPATAIARFLEDAE